MKTYDIPSTARRRSPPIGVISGAMIERVFIGLLYVAVALLVLLSVFGTFYALRGQNAPLRVLWSMAVDAWYAPGAFFGAFAIQAMLTVAQWGSRQLTRKHRLWWAGYLLALAPSVYYNYDAYYDPAVAMGAPWLLVLILIIGGDVVPELVTVQQD